MKNRVELIGVYGSDETHALSAWTSTSRELTEEKRKRIPALLKMLWTNNHGTPFEKSSLHFLVTADIASHIHTLKHRVACSINAESSRYKELKDDKYYLPTDWPDEEKAQLEMATLKALESYHSCLNRLVAAGIDRKRAKESARYYLPYNTQLVFDVMFNMRSFLHFQGLRNKPDAQLEIREIAQTMLQLVRENGSFVHTLAAAGLG